MDRYEELADKIEPLFERLNEHDIQLSRIYDVLENMLDKEATKEVWEERPRIGFNK